MGTEQSAIQLGSGDALIVVDMQVDFLPGGALAVPRGDEVLPVLNRYIALFEQAHLPIFATRDWHPANHCSFQARGGSWPSHCVADSPGADFAGDLLLPSGTPVISKATTPETEDYSGFDRTDLEPRLRAAGTRRLFVGGLATDYCVLETVKDAVRHGFKVFLLEDAVRAVNLEPRDGERAEQEMVALGAEPITLDSFAP